MILRLLSETTREWCPHCALPSAVLCVGVVLDRCYRRPVYMVTWVGCCDCKRVWWPEPLAPTA